MGAGFFPKWFGKRTEVMGFEERRFRKLIENSTEIITLVDEHFLPIYRSPASERYTGWTTEERRLRGIVGYTHPDDMESFQHTLGQVLLQPGKIFHVSFRTLHREGRYIWVEGTVINLLQDDSVQAIVTNLRDVTESKAAEEALRVSHEELRLLASHLQDVREEERTSMAREIHDELGQQLTGLKMDVSWLNKREDLNSPAAREKIRGILTLLDATVGTVRRLAAELRPAILDDLGLPEALQWHAKQFAERSGIACAVDVHGPRYTLPPGVATGLFRIFQESLTNVARHARATRVSATLYMEREKVALTVSDDGTGFDVHQIIGTGKTLGLLGMKERALMLGGQCTWTSEPGKGTTIGVSIPVMTHLEEAII